MIWFLGDFEAGFEADREASGADLKLKISIRDIFRYRCEGQGGGRSFRGVGV